MRKLLKFALVGGTVGVAFAVASSSRSDQSEDVAGQAVLVGGSVAAVGAGVGLVLDRRARKKAKRAGRMEAARGFATELIDEARPAVEKMAKRARKRAEKATAEARSRAEKAGKQARKRASKALDEAKDAVADRTPVVVKVA